MTEADRVDAVLPQTQCTRCGFPDCRSYAEAIVTHQAGVDQCPPGGLEGVQRIQAVLRASLALSPNPNPHLAPHPDAQRAFAQINPQFGQEGPRRLAVIDEAWCIGCTLCIKACPVDAIIGANKAMHVVATDRCTGCELCVAPCPVDCIRMEPLPDAQTQPLTGWKAWSSAQAHDARERYTFRKMRLLREDQENQDRLAAKAAHKLAHLAEVSQISDPEALARKRQLIEAAMAKAKASLPKP